MPLDEADLERIRELIASDRAEHSLDIAQRFADSDARIADIGSELALFSANINSELRTVKQASVSLFEFMKKDIKEPLDGLVADQTFVRNIRRFCMWGAGAIGGAWVSVQHAWPYISHFFNDKP